MAAVLSSHLPRCLSLPTGLSGTERAAWMTSVAEYVYIVGRTVDVIPDAFLARLRGRVVVLLITATQGLARTGQPPDRQLFSPEPTPSWTCRWRQLYLHSANYVIWY